MVRALQSFRVDEGFSSNPNKSWHSGLNETGG